MEQFIPVIGEECVTFKVVEKRYVLKREGKGMSYIATVKATSSTSLLYPSPLPQANKEDINHVL